MRIHVTEEARHLSFARQYLRTNVPNLARLAADASSPSRRRSCSPRWRGDDAAAAGTSSASYDIPKATLTRGLRPGHAQPRRRCATRCARSATLLVDLELVTPASKRLWRRFGIWDESTDPAVSG